MRIVAERCLTKEQFMDEDDPNDFANEDCCDEQAIEGQLGLISVQEDGLYCGDDGVYIGSQQATNPFVESISSPKMQAIEVQAQAPTLMERITILATPKHTSSRKTSAPVSATRETIFSTIDRQEESFGDEQRGGVAEQPLKQNNSIPKASRKAAMVLGKPNLVPAARSTATNSIIDCRPAAYKPTNTKPQMERKKFDLKASLAAQRSFNYKPYTGPLKKPAGDTVKHAAK